MKKILVVFAAIIAAIAMVSPAHADGKQVVNGDSVSSEAHLGGTAYMTSYVNIDRDQNGTPNNNNDDRFNFGGVSVDRDIETANSFSGSVWCNGAPDNYGPNDGICFAVYQTNSRVNWTKITIRKLVNPNNPGAGYETHWSETYNQDGKTDFFLPQTSIDWEKKPFVKVEVDYDNDFANNNTITKSAWLNAWE